MISRSLQENQDRYGFDNIIIFVRPCLGLLMVDLGLSVKVTTIILRFCTPAHFQMIKELFAHSTLHRIYNDLL